MSIKALIFDRDGTLIEHVPYLYKPEDVRLLPGVKDGISTLLKHGYLLFIHTNQSGVGRGLYTLEDVDKCNQRMLELLALPQNPFTAICTAPEHPDAPANYRKPSPKFANEIMAKHHLAPDQLCYIGDRYSDIEAAKNANTRAIGISTGLEDLRAELRQAGLSDYCPVFKNFTEAVNYILNS